MANSNFSIFLFNKFKGTTLSHNVLKNLVSTMSLYPSFRQLSKPAISHRVTFQRNKTDINPNFATTKKATITLKDHCKLYT